MELSLKRTITIVALLLLAAAISQPVYTVLYLAAPEIDRLFLWGLEALIFVLLAAFAGAALAQSKNSSIGWSAISAASLLNVVQVGVGLTMFGPFRDVATASPDAAPAASSIVAFSFMVYNAAKVLLALAAIEFGMVKWKSGGKALGGATVLIGVVAMVANTLSMALGRGFSGDLPIAGASGVLVTVLLALCLLSVSRDQVE